MLHSYLSNNLKKQNIAENENIDLRMAVDELAAQLMPAYFNNMMPALKRDGDLTDNFTEYCFHAISDARHSSSLILKNFEQQGVSVPGVNKDNIADFVGVAFEQLYQDGVGYILGAIHNALNNAEFEQQYLQAVAKFIFQTVLIQNLTPPAANKFVKEIYSLRRENLKNHLHNYLQVVQAVSNEASIYNCIYDNNLYEQNKLRNIEAMDCILINIHKGTAEEFALISPLLQEVICFVNADYSRRLQSKTRQEIMDDFMRVIGSEAKTMNNLVVPTDIQEAVSLHLSSVDRAFKQYVIDNLLTEIKEFLVAKNPTLDHKMLSRHTEIRRQYNTSKHYRELGNKLFIRNDIPVEIKIPEVVKYYEQSLLVDAYDTKTIYNLACVLESGTHFSDAMNRYNQVLQLKPDDLESIVGFSRMAEYSGDYANALKFKERLTLSNNSLLKPELKINPSPFVKMCVDYELILGYLSENTDVSSAEDVKARNFLVRQLGWTLAYILQKSAIVNPEWLLKTISTFQEQLNNKNVRDNIEKTDTGQLAATFSTILNLAVGEVANFTTTKSLMYKARDFVSLGGSAVRLYLRCSQNANRLEKLNATYDEVSKNNNYILQYVAERKRYLAKCQECRQKNRQIAQTASMVAFHNRNQMLEEINIRLQNASNMDNGKRNYLVKMRADLLAQQEIYNTKEQALKNKWGSEDYLEYRRMQDQSFMAYQRAWEGEIQLNPLRVFDVNFRVAQDKRRSENLKIDYKRLEFKM